MKIFNIEATDMGALQREVAGWIMSATHGIDYAKASDFDEGPYMDWIDDSSCWEGDVQAQLEALIEVAKNANGDWIEV